MDLALRSSIRKLLVVALIVTALAVGYIAHSGGGASPARPLGGPVATKKLSAADLLLAASTAQGLHMRYTGITTGALNASHTNDIPLDSFQFGLSRAVSLGGAGRSVGKASVSEITLSHQTDKYSMPLLSASLKGTNATANLYFTNLAGVGGAPFDYLEIDLGQTLISGFSMSSGGDNPSESISLNFVTITFHYKIAGTTTVQTVQYNLATQVGG